MSQVIVLKPQSVNSIVMVLDLVSFRYIFKIRKVNERLNENETNPRVNYFEKKNMACIQSRKRFENKCEVFIELTIKFRGGDSGSALI